ncbi:hypothetical protein Adeh_1851 [Anaeromyxobacter dehalogenans 2CP-C]|uniref:Uncharacterized protein n=1 Tax=Anaeromyxobacter dehalogenans (strain 2CP-C) TaxID=290397 RepID=Q2IIZ6_ANADE|nr:hypothetical protein Adeh_1851 [Anaeromyxobacter dehalogenans 2CP-C]
MTGLGRRVTGERIGAPGTRRRHTQNESGAAIQEPRVRFVPSFGCLKADGLGQAGHSVAPDSVLSTHVVGTGPRICVLTSSQRIRTTRFVRRASDDGDSVTQRAC